MNLPASQSVHDAVAASAANEPGRHGLGSAEPTEHEVFAGRPTSAAFGTTLRWAFDFGTRDLRDDDEELRIRVHMRHFIVHRESAATEIEGVAVGTVQRQIAAVIAASKQSRCAILLGPMCTPERRGRCDNFGAVMSAKSW